MGQSGISGLLLIEATPDLTPQLIKLSHRCHQKSATLRGGVHEEIRHGVLRDTA